MQRFYLFAIHKDKAVTIDTRLRLIRGLSPGHGPDSIVMLGCWWHLDGILAMALASWPPSGRCQLNFEKTPFVTKIQI